MIHNLNIKAVAIRCSSVLPDQLGGVPRANWVEPQPLEANTELFRLDDAGFGTGRDGDHRIVLTSHWWRADAFMCEQKCQMRGFNTSRRAPASEIKQQAGNKPRVFVCIEADPYTFARLSAQIV